MTLARATLSPEATVELRSRLGRGMAAWGIPEPLSLAEWAQQNFYLSAESSYVEQGWNAWPYQRAIMACISNDDIAEVDWQKSARTGYALSLDTPVPTPSGWSLMADLKPGDLVFDELGKTCSVLYVSPVYDDHECFEVEFSDGTKVVADKGHRWFVESDVSFEHLRGERGSGQTGRPKPGQVATMSGVIDTGEMASMLRTSRGRSALAVPVAAPLDLTAKCLPMPPYTLGLWLGDGHMVGPRITQHRGDVETADHIREEGISVSVQYLDKRYPNNASYFLDCEGGSSAPSPWASVMRKMGVLNNKHIPPGYMRGSTQQRLQLLRGLMDSDGNLSRNFAEFVNTNKALADGVFELVVSLGMRASMSSRTPQLAHHLLQYRVAFRPSPTANPFNLARKASAVRWPDKPTITTRRRVVAVRLVPSVPVRCIEVDSQSSLFLCSRSMIPTHNTKIVLAAQGYFAEHKRRNQAVWQPTDDDATAYVKTELDPMLRDVAVMRSVFPAYLSRHKDNTLEQKKFIGSMLHIKGGKAAKNYRRLSVDVAILDELDAFDNDIEKEGDPVSLAAKRIEGATFPKLVLGSTPKLRGFSMIETRSQAADERMAFHIPCPHCGGRHPLTWGGRDEVHGFKWQTGADSKPDPSTTRHLCQHCGTLISQGEYLAVWDSGIWINQTGDLHLHHDGRFTTPDGDPAPIPRHIAFHTWTAYSPAANWFDIVRDFIAAQEKMSEGDDAKMKTFRNTTLGETWEGEIERTDADEMKARAEPFPLRQMPRDCLMLLAGCDVQGNRIEVQVWGYGIGGQMWTIDHRQFFGNPAAEDVWNDLEDFLFGETYPHASGIKQRIHASAIDSGGHHTDAVYAFAHKHRNRRCHSIKGSSGNERSIENGNSKVSFNWRGRREKDGHTLWLVGTHLAKDRLASRLEISQPGPGYVHLSSDNSDEWFRQLASEDRVTKRGQYGTTTRWVPNRKRNEIIDMTAYAIWLEERLDLWSKKNRVMWQRLEETVQPTTRDLFDHIADTGKVIAADAAEPVQTSAPPEGCDAAPTPDVNALAAAARFAELMRNRKTARHGQR